MNTNSQNGEILLPLVRHVPTKLNEAGASRGWLKVGPDPEKLEEMGPGIAKVLQKYNVAQLVSSDLPRAAKTASWLADHMDLPEPETSFQRRTWNSGSEVEGKKEAETIPIRQKYIKNAEIQPRGGEAFQDYLDRRRAELLDSIEYNRKHPDEPRAEVIHGHDVMSIEAMYNDAAVDPKELETLDKDFPPGSVMLLHVRGNKAELERIHPKGFDENVGPGGHEVEKES